jgi:hypothetical protein
MTTFQERLAQIREHEFRSRIYCAIDCYEECQCKNTGSCPLCVLREMRSALWPCGKGEHIDIAFLVRFGDMLYDEEIQHMLDQLSPEGRTFVEHELPWLLEGPPWGGHVIQGAELACLIADKNGVRDATEAELSELH